MVRKCDFAQFDTILSKQNIKFSSSYGGFVCEQNGRIAALQALDKITLSGKNGLYLHAPLFFTACNKAGLAAEMLDALSNSADDEGIALLCAGIMPEEIMPEYIASGFKNAFDMHRTTHKIKGNLWAKADFDTITAASLRLERARFISHPFIDISNEAYVQLITRLYQGGASTAHTEDGYAIYFKSRDNIHIKEMFAENDAAMLYIMQAIVNHDSRNTIILDLSTMSGLLAGEGLAYSGGLYRYKAAEQIDFAGSYNSIIEV